MTNLFLLWRRMPGRDPDPEVVAANLQRIFAPLFAKQLELRCRQSAGASLVYFELRPRGWNTPLSQEDQETWTLALDYPVSARRVLGPGGGAIPADDVLPRLCRKLQEDPEPLLREMSPPFSLVWSSKATGVTWVQNDGLGQAQLFEYQRGGLWAVTNRIFAFKALGLPLEPVPEEWAVRMTLGWFPLRLTGYRGVRFFEPGTQVRVGRHRLARTTHDILSDWVTRRNLSTRSCLELARESLLEHIRAAVSHWDNASILLSGGWDSRAVASSLRAAGADFRARVAGAPVSPDVIIASELARVGNLDLEVNHGGCLPSDDAAECRRRISLALLWEAGYRFTHRHELFLANGRQFSRGGVKISGKHGEIGRAYYAKKYGSESEAKRQEARFVERMMHGMPPFTRRRWRGAVREIIAEAYEQADHYGLTGLARQDFFYLNERTRRLASGSHSAKTGFVFAPFLNPDYLRACFAYPSYEKTAFPFHRHIVSTNTPEWTSVPYAGGSEAHELSRSRSEALKAPETEDEGKSGWRRATGEGNYDSALYWKTTARPIIDECLRDDGFWTELFDPDLVRDRWEAAPQELAITYLLPHVLEEATVP